MSVIVGGRETVNLIVYQLGLTDGVGFWGAIGALSDNFGVLSYVIVSRFAGAWIVSYLVYRINRYDELDIRLY